MSSDIMVVRTSSSSHEIAEHTKKHQTQSSMAFSATRRRNGIRMAICIISVLSMHGIFRINSSLGMVQKKLVMSEEISVTTLPSPFGLMNDATSDVQQQQQQQRQRQGGTEQNEQRSSIQRLQPVPSLSASPPSTTKEDKYDQALRGYRRKVQDAASISPKLDLQCHGSNSNNDDELLHPAFECLRKTTTNFQRNTSLVYPIHDAHAHFNQIRTVMSKWGQHEEHHPHVAANYSGPWVENEFITYFETMYDDRIAQANVSSSPSSSSSIFCMHEIFGPYIPIFIPWTDHWVHNGMKYPEELWTVLRTFLRPTVPYIVVVQNAEGLLSRVERYSMFRIPNVLVLSSGGFGHVPIPLLKQPEAAFMYASQEASANTDNDNAKSDRNQNSNGSGASASTIAQRPQRIQPHQRTYLTSYVGSRSHAPRNQRQRMISQLSQLSYDKPKLGSRAVVNGTTTAAATAININSIRPFAYMYGSLWRKFMSKSCFSFCPRGYGRTSYHVVETWQMGLIPIHVYSDIPWIPYRDLVQREQLAVVLSFKRVRRWVEEVRKFWNQELELYATGSIAGSENDAETALPMQLPRTQDSAQGELIFTASELIWSFERIQKVEARILELRDTHFTAAGVMKQIEKFMLTGERDSDLRCQALPNSIRDM
mmetsp:Transcript_27170/g.76402  ORF Transcript_27170/g.76402 Transcript_27170/m.76402 type:complete len:652 (-) Transcript_27170:71-2026(-)